MHRPAKPLALADHPAYLGVAAPLPERHRSVSCVVPSLNERDNLAELLVMLQQSLSACGLDWEVIVVDDGSSDGTEELLASWAERPGFRSIALSRNFGKEAALTAGLQAARGDAVILLDADLQHSPEWIPRMLAHWQDGADVVYAVRESRHDESAAKRLGSGLFYALVNASPRYTVPKDAGDFRLMDRHVVDALLQLPERSRFMKGLYAWVGFKAIALPYTPQPRASGKSSFNAWRLIHLALDGLTSFTTWPLRMVSVVGATTALLSFLYGGYVTVDHLLNGNAVSGWTTLVVCLLFFMGVQMIFTGILGEYIGRIFEEVKGRPLFVVRRERGDGLPPRGT